ncbi:MAG: tetratricopeptide repeat protein [Bdellovibrionota bacterium]|jgi:tetratricopeptide (TPR) repeat protein
MKSNQITVFIGLILLTAACTEPGKTTAVGAAAGGAFGAGVGAIIGSQTGDAGSGFVIGSLAGAGAGSALGNVLEAQEKTIRNQEEALARQDRQIREQQGQIEELRRMSQDQVAYRDYSRNTLSPYNSFNLNRSSFNNGTNSWGRQNAFSNSYRSGSYGNAAGVAYNNTANFGTPSQFPKPATTVLNENSNTNTALNNTYKAPVIAETQSPEVAFAVEKEVTPVSLPTRVDAGVFGTATKSTMTTPDKIEDTARAGYAWRDQGKSLLKEQAKVEKTSETKAAPANDPNVVQLLPELKAASINDNVTDNDDYYSGYNDDCVEAKKEETSAEQATSLPDRLFHYRRALRLCPYNPRYHNALGEVYLSLERRSDAEYEFKKALDLDSGFTKAAENLEILRISDTSHEEY